MVCVLPRVKSAGPGVRGGPLTPPSVGRTLSVPLPAGTPLLDRDLLPDDVLVDRVRRALQELLRHRVLLRCLALGGRGACRERELDLVEDPPVEEVALARLQLLRVLLGVGQLTELR